MWTIDDLSDRLKPISKPVEKLDPMSLLDSRFRASVVLAGFIVGIVACTSGQRSLAATPPAAPLQTSKVAADVPNLYEDQRQVDEYIRSGRYDKDVAKVIGICLPGRRPTA